MSDNRKEDMYDTGDKTMSGGQVYREHGTGDTYTENNYGELQKIGGGHGGDSGEDGGGQVQKEGGEQLIIFIMLALSGFIVNIVRAKMGYTTYNRIFTIMPIICLILPFVHAECKKKYRMINNLLIVSLMFYIFPKLDTILGSGSNSSLPIEAFLMYGLNAGATAVIIVVIYTITRKIQKGFKIGHKDKDLFASLLEKVMK